jgi:long-chain acyl-CoA synthetase
LTVTDFLAARFAERPDAAAVIAPAGGCTFAELIELRDHWSGELERAGVAPGTVVALGGDFQPNAVALLLALLDRSAIVVFEGNRDTPGREARAELAEVEVRAHVDGRDAVTFQRTGRRASHALYRELRRRAAPGVVAFSSGTSGEPKGAVHDFACFLEKFHARRRGRSTLAFLLFEHLGGINTLLHALSCAATVVTPGSRLPDEVCALIERHRVELLPATPSFFNLLLLSKAHRHHDLSSLRVISYGAEPMPQATLDRLRVEFPQVKLQQTYGLIEVGVPRSKSRDDGSLWVKIGGEGFETRVVDGVLQVRSHWTIIGYLNARSPITPDGWFVTGDLVEQDGDYLRFLGRQSELINVGGRKVYPAEVENVIQAIDGVDDVVVRGEPNRLMGQVVTAEIRASDPVDPAALAKLVKRHCRQRLDVFKAPVKVQVITEPPTLGGRLKKPRRPEGK